MKKARAGKASAKANGSRRPSQNDSLGNLILNAIRRVIDRTVQVGKHLPLPGEGDERAFRGWLKSQLLVAVLGWPDERIRSGEIFDILLLDEYDQPVVTVETKAPFHRSTKEEQDRFRERLSLYPTLRAAFFTNGPAWDRLDLVSSKGHQEVYAQASLEISQASTEQAESFFAPLRGDPYFVWGKRNRSLVTRAQPHILEGLAKDLDSVVVELSDFFRSLFNQYEGNRAGEAIRGLTRSIFQDWCHRSLQATPQQVLSLVAPLLGGSATQRATLASALREQGFSPRQSNSTVDRLLALSPEELSNEECLHQELFSLYADQVNKLCAQSAHVLLARVLVYRIGEDMGLFTPLLGGEALQAGLVQREQSIAAEPTPGLYRLESVRRRMVGVLPVVYQLSDLDWWAIPEEKKVGMETSERAFVEAMEVKLDQLVTRVLRVLDGYHFDQVDADVWRNVYQHYLPAEERQRLGGFYTPQELVEFILDLAEYVPDRENLCCYKVLDPACGSGAFVAAAAVRLLKHLEQPLACHDELGGRHTPSWERQQRILERVMENIHGIDLHPFAAFLTTLNLTFLLLPMFATVRQHNPTFTLNFRVFSADSLEKPDEESLTPDMFEQLNSRIQLTAASFQQYRTLMDSRFGLVCGNPPWGGVLKGPLAPIFEERRKQRFRREYPNAAVGKYDVYGLFMERGLQLLADGGRFAMVTQDTYLDKEWAKGLRQLLAARTELQTIVDLNPFGQLFFKAMNTPAVTVFDNTSPGKGSLVGVLTKPATFRGIPANERRRHVLDTVRHCLERLRGHRRTATVDFATASRIPHQLLRTTASKRWDLTSRSLVSGPKRDWLSAADILEPRQGVTPGGCLRVFLISREEASAHGLESDLVYPAIKTRETERWYLEWEGRVLLYPYVRRGAGADPAFAVKHTLLTDSLDLEVTLDEHERELRTGRPLNNDLAREIIEHRIALGLVEYPHAARYLARHYVQLDSRVFEKRRFSQHGKQWYEYHRKRDVQLVLVPKRIISPRLTREPRFALDVEGFLADDACQYLLPTEKTLSQRERLRRGLCQALGREASDSEILYYCLAFLNSPYAHKILTSRRPTPKGSYQVSDEFLAEIPVVISPEREDTEEILACVERLTHGLTGGEKTLLEARLFERTMRLLSAD